MTAVKSKPVIPRRRGEHTKQHMSTLLAVYLVLGWLAGLPLYADAGGWVLIECPAVEHQTMLRV